MKILESKHLDFLKEVNLFKNLNDEQIKQVASCLETKEVNENELVFSRLEKEEVLYIVRYGSLLLEMVGSEDMTFEKGDVFGEVAVINHDHRTGTIKALEPCLLFALHGDDLFDNSKIEASAALLIVKEMAGMITSYLTSAQNTSTASLIEKGENELVEFKSTLRLNLFTKKFDKEIEHAALKTIAAFLNTNGGTLIVGVADDKKILGMENDQFKDDDHTLLHLTKLIQERINIEHTRFIKGHIEHSNGNSILRIDVKPASSPAYVVHNNEEYLYVRTGPATTPLKVSEVYNFVNTRFFKR
jgi:CRP-like cAMP-binding protein